MNEEDMKKIWNQSANYEIITINNNQLMNDFKYKMEHREGIVRRRDRNETIGAIFGIILFGYTFYNYPTMISRIGSILGILSLIFIIFKLRVNRKSNLSHRLFLPLKDQLTNQKQFMLNQIKLLRSVFYWLSLPLFLANALIIWGISKSPDSTTLIEELSTKWEVKLILTIILVIPFAYLAWMNRKAARVNWTPLILQINQILKNLEEEADTADN